MDPRPASSNKNREEPGTPSVSDSSRLEETAEEKTAETTTEETTPEKKKTQDTEKTPDTQNTAPDPPYAEELASQVRTADSTITFFGIFRYATAWDYAVLAVSAVGAIAAGGITPTFPLLFGDMAGLFRAVALGEMPRSEFDRQLVDKSLILVYLGIGSFVATYISTAGFMATGERLTRRIRQRYLDSLMRQNMAFFDDAGAGVLSSRISLDCQTIQDGISERVAFATTATATLAASYIVGFATYWKLTLVASSVVVLMAAAATIAGRVMVRCVRESMAAYSVAGGLAEEVLGTVRTVKALGARGRFAARFATHLAAVERCGRRAQLTVAVMIAVMLTTTFMSHALTFWTGSIFIAQREAAVSDVITVGFAILVGSHILAGIGPHIRAFGSAVGAASKVFAVIDRPSPLDPASDAGDTLESVSGALEFRAVTHVYPSRPRQRVFDGLDLRIPAGRTTAVVGPSGSGKSTLVALLERFYSPLTGAVLLDGHDVATLNLRWFRRRLGLVGQEPVLFGTTIFDNIAMGLDDDDRDNIEDRVHSAAKQANAHDFVLDLPRGYDTVLGDGGSQLSGGQKQRIAIARALVRDPAVLLLDEATSALDAESEQTVREAIRSASVGRTTVIISHRLSTITDADNIVVLSAGRVVEQGTHSELQAAQGVYANLFRAQQLGSAEDVAEDVVSKTLSSSGTGEDTAKASAAAAKAAATASTAAAATAGQKYASPSLWQLIKLTTSFNRPEARLLIVGLVFSVLAGCAGPALAFLLAHAIDELSRPASQTASMRAGANFWCLLMFVVGLAQLLNLLIQGVLFAICSERLVFRARDTLFRALLRKDVAFFDREENRTGALTAPLGTEAKSLAGVSGSTLGTVLMSCSTLVASAAISLAVGWKVALVCIATIPVLLACGFYRVWMIAQFAQRSHRAQGASAAFAAEAVAAVRTLASLAADRSAAARYAGMLRAQERRGRRAILRSSAPYAASQSFSFFCVALAFWYGGSRIADREYSIFQFFLCFAEVIFGAQSAGMVFSFANDIGKAKKAAATFNSLLREAEPPIDGDDSQPSSSDSHGSDEKKKVLLPHDLRGELAFDDVHFRYPNRQGAPILDGLTLAVRPGEHVALVGASGCGKSTCFALLERLYDPDAGFLRVDGHDLRDLDVAAYRGALAYVSQEPTVYSGTIRDNVLLGCGPSQPEPTDDDVVRACRDANLWDFVSSLPDGLSTNVGARGGMLSGGQKQRLAIARALVRNPRVLLLDEATSALDPESERLVQDALDRAARGRTTVSVAHRLSSIQACDRIYVIHEGRVVETGAHAELMGLRGRYYGLAKKQALGGEV